MYERGRVDLGGVSSSCSEQTVSEGFDEREVLDDLLKLVLEGSSTGRDRLFHPL